MLTIETTMDPYAVEIHRDGKSIGVIRWYNDNWTLTVPNGDGSTIIPWDIMEIATKFRRDKDHTDRRRKDWEETQLIRHQF